MTSTNEKEPLFLLVQIGNSIHQLNRRFEAAGLSLVQWYLLKKLIDMPASSAKQLATALSIHPSTLTPTLKRLESKEFILILEDPKDSRKKQISISRSGRTVLEKSKSKLQLLSEELNSISTEMRQVHITLIEQANNTRIPKAFHKSIREPLQL